jgi:hypothetical protein
MLVDQLVKMSLVFNGTQNFMTVHKSCLLKPVLIQLRGERKENSEFEEGM